jgi:glutamate carboxypeptidase
VNEFVDALTSYFPAYVRDLETLVNMDCGTYNKAGVDSVAALLRERMREFGAEVVDFPHDKFGNCVYGRWRGRGAARVFLVGHMDTVYSDGTAAQYPFRHVGSRVMGAGVDDMKGGVLNGLYAIHAIVASGFDDFTEIGLFSNSDEEVGSPFSREVYPQFARGADAALVLESGRASGAIVSARKGVGTYKLTVHGKSAHAGVEPDKGANAILALARYVQGLQALNGFRPGMTVNVGVVRGGTRPNVVADHAEAEIDLRVVRAQDAAAFEQAARDLLDQVAVPGTRAELVGGVSNPPMEKTAASERLVGIAKNAAHELGFEIEDVITGGGSDGNYTAALGTPTLDGLGPVGGLGHNAKDEYTEFDTIVPRAAMLAKIIVEIAKGR